MKKVTQTQKNIMLNIQKTIDVINKYETFEQFFDNSKNEQNTLTTGYYCNGEYDTSEKYKNKNNIEFEQMKKSYELAKQENIIIVFAKTETLNKLEQLGYIKIVIPAKYKNGAETIKLLNKMEE
jgi:hypothetical protein